jgi:hypothetical protein
MIPPTSLNPGAQGWFSARECVPYISFGDPMMDTITNESELVEFLFQQLDESKPQQPVEPSFLLRIGGICYGMIWGGLQGDAAYLFDMFGMCWQSRSPNSCGAKLVAFARTLAAEDPLDPAQVLTTRRLIELMLAALDSNGLRVRVDPGTGKCTVVSTRRFAERRGVRIRVQLEPERPSRNKCKSSRRR